MTAPEAIAHVMALPAQERSDALLQVVATALDAMEPRDIEARKSAILVDLDLSNPLVRDTVDLMEGHLALRQFGLFGTFPPRYGTT